MLKNNLISVECGLISYLLFYAIINLTLDCSVTTSSTSKTGHIFCTILFIWISDNFIHISIGCQWYLLHERTYWTNYYIWIYLLVCPIWHLQKEPNICTWECFSKWFVPGGGLNPWPPLYYSGVGCFNQLSYVDRRALQNWFIFIFINTWKIPFISLCLLGHNL